MKDMFIALMIAVSILCGGLYSGYLVAKVREGIHEGLPRPPTCIEARGPATDKAEHLWSAHCISNSPYTPSHCIESACIAFRGLP